jgi:D-glucosaminate-6-phosphate ammonia-lyase
MTDNTVLLSRRALLGGSLAAGAALVPGAAVTAAEPDLSFGSDIYASIGVRPLINCKGTFTIITGSQSLPEVKQAMDQASRRFVQLDELMDAVGKRLGELTGAEWGIVSAGCSAAETLATCACVAGGNPEKMQRIPDLRGMKDEVIIPRYSRNQYDHGVRMAGVKLVTVDSIEECEAAFGPRTAMVYILASPPDTGPLGLEPIARLAKARGVPVLVDAAAEDLTPQLHLKRGADLVAYSGGKAIRGPQCAGLLLGRKDLCKAAWINSAPHHAFGRSLKVGKEEIMGMLAAVEMWYRRDHKAEWRAWEGYLAEIARAAERVSGVRTEVRQPTGLSNRAPQLRIAWDGTKLGITGREVFDALQDGNPRIILAGSTGEVRGGGAASSVTVMPWMMNPGEDKVVAGRLQEVLSKPPKRAPAPEPAGPTATVAGRWNARLEFIAGADDHTLFLEQNGATLVGTHRGESATGSLRGSVEGSTVEFRSGQPLEGTRLEFTFRGQVSGDSMSGTVDLGEYGAARFTAKRHRYEGPGRAG